MCLAVSSLSLNARAQDERAYTEGPVTEVDYIRVEYGHFEEYIDWLNSTWKPTMEAMKPRRPPQTPPLVAGSKSPTWRWRDA
jgi:hypothetical protein